MGPWSGQYSNRDIGFKGGSGAQNDGVAARRAQCAPGREDVRWTAVADAAAVRGRGRASCKTNPGYYFTN